MKIAMPIYWNVDANPTFNTPWRPRRAMRAGAAPLVLILLAACGTGDTEGQAPAAKNDMAALFLAPKEGEPLATTGDEVLLTAEELEERISQQSPFMRPRFETPEGRRELVDQLVQFELLAREAVREEIHLEPEVQQAIKRALVNQLMARKMRHAEEQAEIPEDRVREYYEQHIADFVQPERVRVSHIFIAAEDDREEARARAGRHAATLRASGVEDASAFVRMAREVSDDPATKSAGGDLRYQSAEQLSGAWGEKMADAAFALERVGAISDLVEGDRGFHILRLVARQKAVDRKLEDVRPQIVNRVRRDERTLLFESFINEIKSRENLVIDEDRLAALGLDPKNDGPQGTEQASEPAQASADESGVE